jgi:DNA-binding HxlR family transcriptional regulator
VRPLIPGTWHRANGSKQSHSPTVAVDYSLTERVRQLLPAFEVMRQWGLVYKVREEQREEAR